MLGSGCLGDLPFRPLYSLRGPSLSVEPVAVSSKKKKCMMIRWTDFPRVVSFKQHSVLPIPGKKWALPSVTTDGCLVCHLFQALWLCLTWSQVSRSITSPGFRSSWVKSVISVTTNRPVLLEHSKRRGCTSRISCCSLQYSLFRGTELLRNRVFL